MLSFVIAVLRVIAGFALASLSAGIVQVLFAVTPTELVYADDARLGLAANWGLLTATQIFVFAAPFALIWIILSEWLGLRSFAYHALVAMAIAVAGFGLIHANESPTEASIVNSYAMAAYLTSGFVGGFFYWLIAGRLANRRRVSTVRMETDRSPLRAVPSRTEADEAAAQQAARQADRRARQASAAEGASDSPPDLPADKRSGVPLGVPKTGGRSPA